MQKCSRFCTISAKDLKILKKKKFCKICIEMRDKIPKFFKLKLGQIMKIMLAV